jgi:hypothetical protein
MSARAKNNVIAGEAGSIAMRPARSEWSVSDR